MKNTLILAFLASSGALYAATSDVVVQTKPQLSILELNAIDATFGEGGDSSITAGSSTINFEASGSLTSFAITFQLNELSSTLTAGTLLQKAPNYSGWGIRFVNGSATFNNGTNSGAWNGTNAPLLSTEAGDTLTFLFVANEGSDSTGACYIVNQTTGDYISAPVANGSYYPNAGGAMTLTSGTVNWVTSDGAAQATLLGITDLSAYNADNLQGLSVGGVTIYGSFIPEPATATLSLLALAGLAARRRRH